MAIRSAALVALMAASPVAAQEMVWRELDPANTVLLELAEGSAAIELNPQFAPKTVEQFRRLVQTRFYDGLGFYRVIDGFVAQGGDGSDLGELSEVPTIDPEFEIDWRSDLPFIPVQQPDLFADQTGFIDGFAAGRDLEQGKVWLTHCPGVVALARGDDADTSRTDFYIVIGQAPRYLDRNLTIFGRVVLGMDAVQKIRRGPTDNNGIITGDLDQSRIRTMRLQSDIPEQERLRVFVMDTGSKAFEQLLEGRRDRRQKFFLNKPPQVLDVCQVPVAGRMTK